MGASTGLGRALAEKYASAGNDLVLLSRDGRDIEALAAHLLLRFGSLAVPVAIDLAPEANFLPRIDQALAQVSPLRGVLLPVGASEPDDHVGLTDELLMQITNVNFLSPCRIVNALLPRLGNGEVIGFGSVAALRGRSRNAAYAASKRAFMTYFESIRHSAGPPNIAVRFYIPGYLDTNLAFGQKLLFRAADPRRLARLVHADSGRSCTRYYPAYWRCIVLVVSMLPWAIYRRLKF